MKRVLCSRRMKACDRKEILSRTPSSVLMDRAAEAVFEVLKSDFNCERVLFVCGGGNNGGDGILAAVKAFSAGFDTAILFCGDEALCTAETSDCLKKARDCGVPFVTDIEKKYTVIVDAIFGIGLSREIDGSLAEIIEKVNGIGAKVLSVDIPSGICADNGEIMGTAVKADVTVAVAAYKMGHFTGEAADYVGRIVCVDIGIPTEDADNYDGFGDIVPYALDFEDIALLPERPRNANKGTCGRVLIVGGAKGMCGAVYLSALAAYRIGAGLVEVFCDEENRIQLQTLLPEAVVTCSDFSEPDMNKLSMALCRADAVCIGPGMSRSIGALRILSFVYKNIRCPLVADADALNLTAQYSLVLPGSNQTVITPHPLELSRLTDIPVDDLKAAFWINASEYAREKGVVCVAKDHATCITDGKTVYINTSGTPALAKGGSGDVLSGVITAFLCRGLDGITAASLGAYVHGAAGEYAERYYGVSAPLASEVADMVGEVLREAGR